MTKIDNNKTRNTIRSTIKRITAVISAVILILTLTIINYCQIYASSVPQEDTPEYKVSFYASDCYNMQDENGKRSGYAFEMLQGISKYIQCTFSYEGYDKSPKECEELLREGKIDIYTAARITPEREEEFVFSTHPAITAKTCMNIKRGNTKVSAGDYSTYNGMRIGLLRRHTYNDKFIAFTNEKGIQCEIVYYDTPTDLSNALITGEVDALVNSYIRTPEDEVTIESFGETPYYFMARKENEELVQQIDAAIDEMNIETPNWRGDLYNKYYGSQNSNTRLTVQEQELLAQMQENNTVVRAVMNPERNPYSWYEDGEGLGIAAELFKLTADRLGLDYEIVPVNSVQEYKEVIASGNIDIVMDMSGYYEDMGDYIYKMTDPYLTTTVSVLHRRGASGKNTRIGVLDNNIAVKEIVSSIWPAADIVPMEDSQQCIDAILEGDIDCALMMSYTAQKAARDDTRNRFSVDVVPGAEMSICMGVNSKDSRYFYGMWEKTLAEAAADNSTELVQRYAGEAETPTLLAYLYDHPEYFFGVAGLVLLTIFIIILFILSTVSRKKQMSISKRLAEALEEAESANAARLNFFSKMSHDIRTPLNAVLGMTQIAKKCEDNPEKLDNALDKITAEGSYLLTMINSILDINQLEHGRIELVKKPFNLDKCLKDSIDILKPLAIKKNQTLTVTAGFTDCIVIGDSGRFSQIIVNIVSNAIKYTGEGGKIDVSLTAASDNRYRLVCTDNGVGMSQEFLKHICEDYSRAEDSRISVTEGTGLGMAVVKGFTSLMGGTLTIESTQGEGSTFTVEIPFEEPSAKSRQLILDSQDAQKQSVQDFKGKKVLLVEDNVLNAEIAAELLNSIGFVVDWAENGKAAVEKYEQSGLHTYYVIFMDMQMPVMNGIDTTKQIRSLKREDRDVPIFAMTANTHDKDRKDCIDAGMNGYITKPINITEIQNTIREYMNV